MTADAAERLRTLAKDYSRGQLTFDAYRRERTSLLDSLDAPLPAATPTRARWVRPLVAVCGVALAAVTIVALVSWHSAHNSSPERQPAPAPRQLDDGIQKLIEPLLNDPDWDDARVAAVNEALLEEGPRRIAARQETEWFQRFATEVRRHMKQQQSSARAALAVTIGLDPDAIDEPLRAPGSHRTPP